MLKTYFITYIVSTIFFFLHFGLQFLNQKSMETRFSNGMFSLDLLNFLLKSAEISIKPLQLVKLKIIMGLILINNIYSVNTAKQRTNQVLKLAKQLTP